MNTCESEYNLTLENFWPKMRIQKAEVNRWLGSNHMGEKGKMSSIETVTINKMIIEVYRLTKNLLCIHQDNVMRYYDKITRNYSILCSKNFGIPDNICKINCQTHDILQFRTQIKNKISTTT